MSHKVYVGSQGSTLKLLKAQFSPEGLENPVTYVPEVPEWDGKTRVRDVDDGMYWVFRDGMVEMLSVYRLNMGTYVTLGSNTWMAKEWLLNCPAIPIVEPKPLEESDE